MPNLPSYIDTDKQWNEWENFLMELSHEELVQFVLSRMASNSQFMNLAYGHFVRYANEDEADKVIEEFNTFMNIECREKSPDTDYIVSIANQYIVKAQNAKSLKDKIKIFSAIIIRLDKAIVEDGVGMYEDDDWLIIELMDDAARIIKGIVSEQIKDMTKDQKSALKEFINQQCLGYDPVDGTNRIAELLGVLQ